MQGGGNRTFGLIHVDEVFVVLEVLFVAVEGVRRPVLQAKVLVSQVCVMLAQDYI